MDERTTASDLQNAMDRARLIEVDHRGLMPIDEARAVVKAATEFRRGRGRRVGGEIVLERDVLWAALLSLEDAREFLRQARRLVWTAEPRGPGNAALAERYGAGVLPWIGDHVDADGGLEDTPACLAATLIAIGTAKAFELAYRIQRVNGSVPHAVRLFKSWMRAHPRTGFPRLADRAEAGERRARKMLRHLANRNPAAVHEAIRRKRGREATDALLEKIRVVSHLTESAVLSLLDLAAEREIDTETTPWPIFRSRAKGAPIYHGMRMIAARARRGDRWGIVFERLIGSSPENALVEVYRYGSSVRPGLSPDHCRALPFEVEQATHEEAGLEGVVVHGPAGRLELEGAMVDRLHLKTRGLVFQERREADYVHRLRAYLAHFPDAFWIRPDRAVRPLEIGKGPEVIVDTHAFTHVLGTDASDIPSRDKFWLAKPSDTRIFRTLARALVDRDSRQFRPGKSNLDWR